ELKSLAGDCRAAFRGHICVATGAGDISSLRIGPLRPQPESAPARGVPPSGRRDPKDGELRNDAAPHGTEEPPAMTIRHLCILAALCGAFLASGCCHHRWACHRCHGCCEPASCAPCCQSCCP